MNSEYFKAKITELYQRKINISSIIMYLYFRLLLEKKKQDELLDQIDSLRQKVANANEGLAAANRLSEQLEKKTQAIAMLKHEIKLREDLLKKAQNELKDANSGNTVKVDRYLVKNLVVGYVNADQNKKLEVLKIIGKK